MEKDRMHAHPVRSFAIFLGPYRNLTTLTAATLSLHPECQVLNHASERLLANAPLNFFDHPDVETMQRFIAAGRAESAGGRRGQFGGSIVHSHAYDDDKLKQLYFARFNSDLSKPHASCLVWKDSMRIQLRIMSENGLFDRLCDTFEGLKFIMPIRNPVDCAVSSMRTGHVEMLCGRMDVSLEDATVGVLNALAWVLEQKDRRPDRVFIFTQNDDVTNTFESLSDFLKISRSETWSADVLEAFQIRKRYQASEYVTEFLRNAVQARLGRWPEVVAKILG